MPILVSLQPLVKCPAIKVLLPQHSYKSMFPFFGYEGKSWTMSNRAHISKNASAYLHFLGDGTESNISKEKRFTQASVLPEILLPIFAKDLRQFFSGFFHPCIFKAPEVIKCSFVAVSSQIEPIICIQSLYAHVQVLKN